MDGENREAEVQGDESALVLVLDVNPYWWGLRARNSGAEAGKSLITLSRMVEHTMLFINAFLMLHPDNQLAVLACHPKHSWYIYPRAKDEEAAGRAAQQAGRAGAAARRTTAPAQVNKAIAEQLRARAIADMPDSETDSSDLSAGSNLAGALSLGLCFARRVTGEHRVVKPRVLVLSVSPDVPAQYIPVMNCIFAAQKSMTPIDACVLATSDSSFLQQAAHITGGVYVRPPNQDGLLQYLLTAFLADRLSRRHMRVPSLASVDYRASCFCHKKTIDLGFVCSVCLSIFCQFSPVCATCGTKFTLGKLPTLPVKPRKKPVKKE